MKITRRENFLLRRALDKASTPGEVETAAKALIASLRARDVSGYDIVPAEGQERPQSPPGPSFCSLAFRFLAGFSLGTVIR